MLNAAQRSEASQYLTRNLDSSLHFVTLRMTRLYLLGLFKHLLKLRTPNSELRTPQPALFNQQLNQMLKLLTRRRRRLASVFFVLASLILFVSCSAGQALISSAPHLLTDPFLQLPTENSVRVVWFTEFAGSRHHVVYGANLDRTAVATTTKLSRTREDKDSKLRQDGQYSKPTSRDIWRHEAEVSGLTPRTRIPYQVTSVREDGKTASSAKFTLASKPTPGTPLKILLTSDHQVMPMITANLQMVVETVGRVDGVFFAGNAVNHPDRASEWFDDKSGGAFFPSLQGIGSRKDEKTQITYRGGELIQHAPLFTAIGNHEVMGRFSMESGLNDQFNDAFPRAAAQSLYEQSSAILNPGNDPTVRDRKGFMEQIRLGVRDSG